MRCGKYAMALFNGTLQHKLVAHDEEIIKKPGQRSDLAERELMKISSGSGRACRGLPPAR